MRISFTFCAALIFSGAQAFHVPTKFGSLAHSSKTVLNALVDIHEGTARDVNTMEQWATSCGVQTNGAQLFTQDGLDWSFVASQDIPTGTSVLSVPENMILSTSKVKAELGNVLQPGVDQLSRLGAGDQAANFYLFAKVLIEYEKGDQSPYFYWLNSMPRLFFNAVSMTDFCYECLPSLTFSLARAERVKYDNFVKALEKVEILSPQTMRNPELIKWAFNVVYTRSWGSSADKQIVPMADMFNHGTETEVAITYDDNGNCFAQATRDIPAGSPIRMMYGDPTNPSHLFATYGFLDETSPATFCKIMTIQPTPQLIDMGYGLNRMLFYKDTGDITEEVWDVLLYNILGSNKQMQQALYEAHVNGDVQTKSSIHQQYFVQTSTALKNHVDGFLSQLDDLADRANGRDVNQYPRLPLIMRHNDFVRRTFLNVKAKLDPMVASASGQVAPMFDQPPPQQLQGFGQQQQQQFF